TVDLEAWKYVMLPNLKLRVGGGIRYGEIDRDYFARETGGSEFVRFHHDFKGFGPSLSYEIEVPLQRGFAVYNSARASLLFGNHNSFYEGENTNFDQGALTNNSFVPTIDTEIGLQWQGQVGGLPGSLRLRAGVEAQAWMHGGGWDFFHDDMGAQFPQHAGSFGVAGFSLGAQYTFAMGGGNPYAIYEYDTSGPAIVPAGFFVGARASYLNPFINTDVVGADESIGPQGELEIFSLDWAGGGAYKAWAGYETAHGLGVSLSHMGLDQSTSFSRAENGGSLQSHFDPDTDDASIFVNGTLNARETLSMNVTDLEVWQKVKHPNIMVRYGFGARYANIDRNLLANETDGDEFINFDHSFTGFGPSLSYEVEVPLPRPGFSIYNSARASLLFGEHKSAYQGEQVTNDAGFNNSMGFVPTFDTELGVQWRRYTGSGELTLRAGVEAQAWINGGGFDLYDDDGGALFPQNSGSFGLIGLNIGANYKFGVAGQDYAMLERDNNAPAIVAPGFFAGAEAVYLTPAFTSDVAAYDSSFGADNSLRRYSFDWDGAGAYRVWGGYETAQGTGISVTHFGLDHSTRFSMAEEPGGNLQVDFDPDSDDVNINVDGTLNTHNALSINATDLEIWQKVMLGGTSARYGAGVRFASVGRDYHATETDDDEFVRFNHDFHGVGPSVSYEVEVPVYNNFSIYNFGRAALLFGEHKSNYQGENDTGDKGQLNNFGMVPTVDAELGVQWQSKSAGFGKELTVRAGVEAQGWINGGGWNMHQDDGGALWPQQNGSFGLYGATVSASMKF
ncbi:MAG: Lpg1974 family pore-forming outer membrane protein, partial [Pseudomonadota bacterium]